jgi:hypothetical protein
LNQTLDPHGSCLDLEKNRVRVLPALLGYYHLGRLGFVLNVAAGFALAWMMAVCGILCFAYLGHHLGSVWLSTVAYAACVVFVYLLIARLHLRAATSPSVVTFSEGFTYFPLAALAVEIRGLPHNPGR